MKQSTKELIGVLPGCGILVAATALAAVILGILFRLLRITAGI